MSLLPCRYRGATGSLLLGLVLGQSACKSSPLAKSTSPSLRPLDSVFFDYCMLASPPASISATITAIGRSLSPGLQKGINCETLSRQLYVQESLDLSKQGLSDLRPLAGLPQLRRLLLADNAIRELDPLQGLALTQLDLRRNKLGTLEVLSGLKSLTGLQADGNALVDVYPIARLPLTLLSLSDNRIFDISALANATSLRALALAQNRIVNVKPLAALQELVELDLSENAIVEVDALAGLPKLRKLSLHHNAIADASPLAGLAALTSLELALNPIASHYMDLSAGELAARCPPSSIGTAAKPLASFCDHLQNNWRRVQPGGAGEN